MTDLEDQPCDMCGHLEHHDTDCGVICGYDHLNGDHECGCPGSLTSRLAQAWDEGFEDGHLTARAVNPEYPEPATNPYRAAAPNV